MDAVPVEAVMDDMQSRFNLNNLVRHGVVSEPDLAQFRRLLAGRPAIAVPDRYWTCSGWFLAEAAAYIAGQLPAEPAP